MSSGLVPGVDDLGGWAPGDGGLEASGLGEGVWAARGCAITSAAVLTVTAAPQAGQPASAVNAMT